MQKIVKTYHVIQLFRDYVLIITKLLFIWFQLLGNWMLLLHNITPSVHDNLIVITVFAKLVIHLFS